MKILMRAKRQALLASRIDSLKDWRPDDLTNFGLYVQILLGPSEDSEGDSFDVGVCSPRWFAERFEAVELRQYDSRPLYGRHVVDQLTRRRDLTDARGYVPTAVAFGTGIIFMRQWHYGELEQAIASVCEQAEGPDWGTVASRIERLLPWEYIGHYDAAVNAGETFP